MSTPPSSPRTHWQQHCRMLWWLGLLYRRPAQFNQALDRLSTRRALQLWILLFCNAVPYLIIPYIIWMSLFSYYSPHDWTLSWPLFISIFKPMGLQLIAAGIFGCAVMATVWKSKSLGFGITFGLYCAIVYALFIGRRRLSGSR